MSPDERSVGSFIDRAVSRARILALARAVAWTLLAAAVGVEVALVARLPVGATAISAALAGALLGLRRRVPSRARVLASIERATPGYRNLLITANELREDVYGSQMMRARVFADAAAVASRADVKAALPASPALRHALIACAAWVAVVATALFPRSAAAKRPSISRSTAGAIREHAGSLHITATIDPPAYTGLPSRTAADPPELQAIEGSRLTLIIDAAVPRVVVTYEGSTRALDRSVDGRFTMHEPMARTGYVLVDAAASGRRTVPVVITPDALPDVRLTAPGRDLVFAGGNARLVFDARATDDFGVRSLALRYTRVTGSGEQFEFEEGEIPLAIEHASPRDWRGRATRALGDLDLHDGDMLVYRAVASDARPGDGTASSDAFFIEISKLGVAAGDAFTLPEQETRYALSEQMLIVKTDRLEHQRGTIAAADFNEAAVNLGVEQRMIRAEFVFMLGGEIQDEEVEAEQSTELQEGRLQNHGQRDLRTATVTMSQAEKLLTAGNMADALKAEHAAVDALQRAFTKDRYILRALATHSQLDLSRRLTGDLALASDWRRRLPDTPANRRAAQLQDLLRGLGALIVDLDADQATARRRAEVLSEQALRTDATSPALREAATSLQRIADAWSATDRAARMRALTAVSAGVAAEAGRALAGALPPAPDARALRGAFADALRPGASR